MTLINELDRNKLGDLIHQPGKLLGNLIKPTPLKPGLTNMFVSLTEAGFSYEVTVMFQVNYQF